MRRALVLAVLLIAACGGGSTEGEGDGAGDGDGTTGGEGGTGGGGGGSGPSEDEIEGRLIAVAPGFVPDPKVVQGHAGGPQNASSFSESCVGWMGADPNHTLVLSGAFPMLAVMASSPQDITLAIQTPAGEWMCNDDYEQTHPYVRLDTAAAGTYRVFVGTYQQGTETDYTLGVTALANITPGMLTPGQEQEDIDLGDVEPGEEEPDFAPGPRPMPQPQPAPGNLPPPSGRSP